MDCIWLKITIPKDVVNKVKNRQGIYSKLGMNKSQGDLVYSHLKIHVTSLVEQAFRRYAKAHKGCDKNMEDREWKRFNKFLRDQL